MSAKKTKKKNVAEKKVSKKTSANKKVVKKTSTNKKVTKKTPAKKKVEKKSVTKKKAIKENVSEKETTKRGPRANSVSNKLRKLLDMMYEKTGAQPNRQDVIARIDKIREKHPEFDPSNALLGVVMCNWRKEHNLPALRKRTPK